MDEQIQLDLRALRKKLYTYHNELLEIERQSRISCCSLNKGGCTCSSDKNEFEAFYESYPPLYNEYILEIIAKYLPSQDLKSCRRVCRLWHRELSRCLAARRTLVVTDENCSHANGILVESRKKDLITVGHLCFFDVSASSLLYKQLTCKFGPTLSGLKFEDCKLTLQELKTVLTSTAPNLESLYLKTCKPIEPDAAESAFSRIQHLLSPSRKPKFVLPALKQLHWDEDFGRVRLEEIVSVCPNLVHLVYKNAPVPFPEDLKRVRWNSLRTLHLSPRDELQTGHCDSLATLKLKIRRLTLFGVNPKEAGRVRSLKGLLKSVSGTLADLELFHHFMFIRTSADYPHLQSPFPLKLPELTYLNVDFSILKSLQCVHSMPKLKMFECKAKFHTDWEKAICEATVKKEHPSVTVLNLGSISESSICRFLRCFKSCTSLELDGEHITDSAFRLIVQGLPELEQFKISKIPLCAKLPLTDSGITGLSLKTCQGLRSKTNSEGVDVGVNDKRKKHPAVFDLKKLKFLDLGGQESPLTDVAVSLGILKIPQLSCLGLPCCNITDRSLKLIAGLKYLTMLELPSCPHLSESSIKEFKETRKDVILQYGFQHLASWNTV